MIILDGGMGQELVKRAGTATDLWSIQALLDAPEMVRDVHDAYFAAGAQIATTNTYALFPDRLENKGLLDKLEPLVKAACKMAVQARDAHGTGLVAGSLGPQGFSYQSNQCPPSEVAAEVYAQMAELQSPYVDFYLLETMSSVEQALGGLMGLAGQGKPVWLSLSVDDDDGTKLRSGEALAEILPLVQTYTPEAVLINCSRPEAVTQGLPVLADCGVKFGAYANGFTEIHPDFNSVLATVDLLAARLDLTPDAYLRFSQEWAGIGAQILGGCCEVGPEHIAAMAQHFKSN